VVILSFQQNGGNGSGIGSSETLVIISFAVLFILFLFYDQIELFMFDVWRHARIYEYMIFSWIPEWIPFFGKYGQLSESLTNLPKEELFKVKDKVDLHFTWPYVLFSIIAMSMMGFNLFKMTNMAKTRYDQESLLRKWYSYTKSSNIKDWDKIVNINKNDNKENEHPEQESHIFDGTNSLYADPSSPWEIATKSHLFMEGLSEGTNIFDPETGVFDTVLAREVFDAQLGSVYTSYANMSSIEKYCFNYITYTISNRTHISLEEAKKRCTEIMQMHCYTRCGLVSILEEGRKSGEFMSSKFSFIKKFDRILFISFSTLGRKLPFAESAGCFAHRELEKALRKRLPIKETTAAIEALAETIGADLSTVREQISKKQETTH